MPQVTFLDENRQSDCESGKTVLQCALEMGVPLSHVCGGDGACGTCRIEVVEGWDSLSAQTPDETYKELDPPFRLGCQARLKGDVVVKVAKIE